MTQEEKQLLIKDICARLPYGVIVHFEGWNPEKLSEVNLSTNVYNGMGGLPLPYLRPMSSMTDEEKEEFEKVMKSCTEKILACPTNERWYQFFDAEEQDFMNAHHFDYRGLIEKGLALEAPKNMYKVNSI